MQPNIENRYTLLDSHFKSDDFKKGRSFKQFFDKFCKQVFETNLKMLHDIQECPIAYTEQMTYSSIAHALHSITPYVWSEASISYKDKKAQKADKDSDNSQEQKEKWRFVDFWCMDSKKEFELWIEAKRVWLKIGKNTKKEFDKISTERVKKAINQIRKIKEAKPYQEAKDTNLKIALFTINTSCAIREIPSDKAIDSIPKILNDLLADFIDNRSKMGVLLGVCDMDTKGTNNKRAKNI